MYRLDLCRIWTVCKMSTISSCMSVAVVLCRDQWILNFCIMSEADFSSTWQLAGCSCQSVCWLEVTFMTMHHAQLIVLLSDVTYSCLTVFAVYGEYSG